MSKLSEILPTNSPRMIDLVEAAGVNVSDWGNFKGGKEKAASNPKYCYEWSFVEPKKVVVLNLWHDLMEENADGIIMRSINMREFASKRPSPERERAIKMDEAIQTAIKEKLPIRVIVLGGRRRNISNPTEEASRVSKRLLDPEVWIVANYDRQNGDCMLRRGADHFVGQFSYGGHWSKEEVESTVSDYFEMLAMELRGESFNKSEHNRQLQKLLNNRTKAAVELKHQNISEVLIELGYPYIDGYKPRGHYQDLLYRVVEERLLESKRLNQTVAATVEKTEIKPPILAEILSILVAPPILENEKGKLYDRPPRNYAPMKKNYLEIESRNQALGRAGEMLVLEFEHQRLWRGGKKDLANRIEHVADTKGDAVGFDILSFETDGRERLIEVKTTRFGALTPFFVSRNEVSVSNSREGAYQLYRLFKFVQQPKLFVLSGSLDKTCSLDPIQFCARPGHASSALE